jgi:hypothetical protein
MVYAQCISSVITSWIVCIVSIISVIYSCSTYIECSTISSALEKEGEKHECNVKHKCCTTLFLNYYYY